jgi:phage terminase large subunit-like protein
VCREAGLILDGWQAGIITDQLGKRDDGTFAAVECGDSVPRQNGKGGIIEARKLAGLFLLGERMVMYTAHQFKTAQEHFLRMKEYVRNSDELGKRVKRVHESHGEEGIELYGEGRHRLTRTQRLLYLARSKGSGRGFTGGCLILDEAQYLTAKQLAALIPTLSALSMMGDPQLIYHGTPPDPLESADGGAYWISVRNRGVAGTGRICWHEYSPPEGFDRTDRGVWYSTNPALGVRISEEFVATLELEAMVAAGTPEVFDRERLGAWPPDPRDGWSVIPQQPWEDAADPASKVEDPVCFAVATNLERTWASIAVCGRRKDGLWHVEVIDRRPGASWVPNRAEQLLAKWRNCGLVVAASGPAGALIADIEAREVKGYAIEIIKASVQDYAKACGQTMLNVSGLAGPGEPDPRILRHAGSPEFETALTAAVKGAAKHETGDVWTFDRDVDVDSSPLEAVALALWGFATYGQNAPNLPATVSPELRAGLSDFFRPSERLKI